MPTISLWQKTKFKTCITKPYDFKFGSSVANVFDEMVNRSVPFYGEIQRMIAKLSAVHTIPRQQGLRSWLFHMYHDDRNEYKIHEDIPFLGVDDSPQMLEKCRSKLQEANFSRKVDLVCAEDLNKSVTIDNASVWSFVDIAIRPSHFQAKFLRRLQTAW